MDFLSLFSGSDNLFKYLLLWGLGLIVLSLFYPMTKKYALMAENANYQKEVQIINIEIDELSRDLNSLSLESNELQSKIKKTQNSQEKEKTIQAFEKKVEEIVTQRKAVKLMEVNIAFLEKKAQILREEIKDISGYIWAFRIFGIIFSILGGFGWFKIMSKTHFSNK